MDLLAILGSCCSPAFRLVICSNKRCHLGDRSYRQIVGSELRLLRAMADQSASPHDSKTLNASS